MHLARIVFFPEKYPVADRYPFDLPVFKHTREIRLDTPVTFFTGENGSGKSTLLQAVTRRCSVMIWQGDQRARFTRNPYEDEFHRFIEVEWTNGMVQGSFFGSQVFQNFARIVDEWATMDPGILEYYGGKSLLAQSHGQSLMSFFKTRFAVEGLYLLDEPETALSPTSQLELLRLITQMGRAGHAQFIVATHSPILMACPDAAILSFDRAPLGPIAYEHTEHYRIYREFMADPGQFTRFEHS